MHKTMKVFDIHDMPVEIRKDTHQWLRDLGRTAVVRMIEYWTPEEYKEWYPDRVQYECDPLDTWLIEQGAENGEEVVLMYN